MHLTFDFTLDSQTDEVSTMSDESDEYMDNDTDAYRFDTRALDRKIDQGKVEQEEYESYVEDLPDVSDNAEPIESEFEEGVLDDDELEADTDESEETE